MILPITLTIAGAAALINFWLATRAGRMRIDSKVSIGDGGHEPLVARMRAHANFVEYTPFVLILIGLVEFARGTTMWLWLAGAMYLLGRIAHAFGMDRPAPNAFRLSGIAITMMVMVGLGIYAIVIPYTVPTGQAEAVQLG